MNPLLDIKDVTVHFGGVKALEEVTFSVNEGELVCLIGPNGAGKTTLLKAITGVVRPQSASLQLAGVRLNAMPIHQRTRLGLAMTHQIVRPFRSMSVLENAALAAGHRRIRNVFKAMWTFNREAEKTRALKLLELVGIHEAAHKPVTGLPLGIIKRLEVARALALKPKILLLDEPLAGLNSHEAARLADTITAINREGLTVVMIEHNLGEVMRIAKRLVVLDNGRKIADGPPDQVMRDPVVRSAYVGKEPDNAAA